MNVSMRIDSKQVFHLSVNWSGIYYKNIFNNDRADGEKVVHNVSMKIDKFQEIIKKEIRRILKMMVI